MKKKSFCLHEMFTKKNPSGLVNTLFKTDFQRMFQAEAIYRHFRKSAISSVLDLPNTVDLDQPLSEEAV